MVYKDKKPLRQCFQCFLSVYSMYSTVILCVPSNLFFIVRWTESSWFDFCVVAIQYRMVTVVNFVTCQTFCKEFDLCFKMVTIKEQWER
jgi:hypothetical protein